MLAVLIRINSREENTQNIVQSIFNVTFISIIEQKIKVQVIEIGEEKVHQKNEWKSLNINYLIVILDHLNKYMKKK